MLRLPVIIAATGSIFLSANVLAHDWNSARPDSHAPISVMGEHTHKTGEFMFSYRHMRMEMNSLVDGDRAISTSDLLGSSAYTMAPSKMTMTMDMLGLMYAPNDSTTLMAMLPYVEKDMDMIMMSGSMPAMEGMMSMAVPVQTSMKSSGLGDLKVGALQGIYASDQQKVHLNLMLSLPTGSIDEKNGLGQALPYGMQLGSGTYDLLPGFTYAAQYDRFSWGAQATATIRLSENDRDYTLGNRYQVQAWIQKPVHQRVSLSARLSHENWKSIDGNDKRLNAMMSPLNDPDLQGGERLVASVGFNVTLPAGNRLAVEYSKELDQNLDGPQMALDDSLVIGWQLSFK